MNTPWLVADIGGTNARFGLVEEPGAVPVRVHVLPYQDYGGPSQAAAHYLTRYAGDLRPVAACVAVAGPVEDGERFRLTNAHWESGAAEIKQDLGLEHVELINDFEALAVALPYLTPGELRPVGPVPPVSGGAKPKPWLKPMAVLGPGTGLGVAGLVPAAGRWIPVPGEGGHADLPATTERELELVGLLRAEYGTASAEYVLSGPGLTRLHRLVGLLHGLAAEPLTAAQICARRGDPLCAETLDTFCSLAGAFAGNVALTFGARGGVYLGGGILPRICDVVGRSEFRPRFESRAPMQDYLSGVPTALILAPAPALTGAAVRLAERLDRLETA